MQGIFVSLLLAGIHGGLPAVGGALGALTGAQWAMLAGGAAEELAPELAKLVGIKPSGNSIGGLIDGVIKATADDLVKDGVKNWISANAAKAMKLQPGMGTDY